MGVEISGLSGEGNAENLQPHDAAAVDGSAARLRPVARGQRLERLEEGEVSNRRVSCGSTLSPAPRRAHARALLPHGLACPGPPAKELIQELAPGGIGSEPHPEPIAGGEDDLGDVVCVGLFGRGDVDVLDGPQQQQPADRYQDKLAETPDVAFTGGAFGVGAAHDDTTIA